MEFNSKRPQKCQRGGEPLTRQRQIVLEVIVPMAST